MKKIHRILVLHGPIWMLHVWVKGLRMDEWVDGWMNTNGKLVPHCPYGCCMLSERLEDGWIVMASWSLMAPYGCYMLSERLEDGWIVVTRDSERALFRRMIFLSFFLCQLGTYQSSNPWKWRQRERHLTKSKHSFISWKRGGEGNNVMNWVKLKYAPKNEQS